MANNGNHTESRFKALSLGLIAVALLIVITSIVYLKDRTSVNNTLHLATTHQPTQFSELYFTDYSSLPKTIKVDKIYAVPFTITNHEGKSFSYSYQATVTEKGKTLALPVKQVSVANGAATHQSVSFSARNRNDLVEVDIRLLGPNLQIHYKALS